MLQTRTRRQLEVFNFISGYIERKGHEPSYQQIAKHLGLASKAGIGKHVKALEEQGLLHRQRENGKFRLRLGRPRGEAGPAHGIVWLAATCNGHEPEEWESEPFVVPEFMLGRFEPADVCAFRVPDDGMSGKNICEGDVVIIEKRTYARDGSCVVATLGGGETLLRCYYRAGADIEFCPENDSFEPVRCPADQVEIHGIFRGLLRPVG